MMGSERQGFRYSGLFSIFLTFFVIFCLALPRKSEAWPVVAQKSQSDTQELRAPQIEMRLLRGRVNPEQNLGIHTEYIYFPKDFESRVKAEPTGPTFENWRPEDMPIDIRNVVFVPSMKCPEGYRRAYDGMCRKIVPMTRP